MTYSVGMYWSALRHREREHVFLSIFKPFPHHFLNKQTKKVLEQTNYMTGSSYIPQSTSTAYYTPRNDVIQTASTDRDNIAHSPSSLKDMQLSDESTSCTITKSGRIVKVSQIALFSHQWAQSCPSSFRLSRYLGQGSFGKVFQATDNFGRDVALKVLHKHMYHYQYRLINTLFRREINNHGRLSHQNIIQLFAVLEDDHDIILVQEYAPRGDLFIFMKAMFDCNRLDERWIARAVYDITVALQHCHRRFIVHGDLKPENILVCAGGRMKLTDFGWSLNLKQGGIKKWRGGAAYEGEEEDGRKCGTPAFRAPEIWNRWKCGTKVDMWSLGTLTYEMLYGRLPFRGQNARWFWTWARFPKQRVSDEARDFVKKLLQKNQEKRMSSEQVLEHHWIKKHVM